MDLTPNFSPKSQFYINQAKQLAFDLNHTLVKEEHLLVCLLESGDELITLFLKKHDISVLDFIDFVKVFGSLGSKKNNLKDISECKFSSDFSYCLEEAHNLSQKINNLYINNEHLFFSLLNQSGGAAYNFFLSINLSPQDITKDFLSIVQLKNLNILSSLHPLDHSSDTQLNQNDLQPKPAQTDQVQSLENFCVNLNDLALSGKFNKVIGRDQEVARIFQILGRKSKNNPILIGDPGVGKTACVESLASSIVSGSCPYFLKDFIVYSVDIASMIAGTKYRGQFEQRLKNLITECTDSKIILFIDEAHTIVGAGAAEGALDAANILKPALARGEIKLITATTYPEYKKSIEKDLALNRRLEAVFVDEPSKKDCLSILQGIKSSYEDFHGVKYSQKCLNQIIDLSNEYLPSKYFPDKAIDILDEAGSVLKIKNFTEPQSLIDIESRLYDLNFAEEDFVQLEESLLNEYEDEYKKWTSSQSKFVSEDLIYSIISKKSKLPIEILKNNKDFNFSSVRKSLEKQIIGQKEATQSIFQSITRSQLGLKEPQKPISSFLFLGLTGTGKTHCAKVLAETYMGTSRSLIRLNMSEYSDKISSSKLIGSSPGYVGYEEGGYLIEKVKKTPHAVILFDEIEKSHPDVRQLLLQILEEGELEDAFGVKAYFKDCIIILTSNIGAHLLNKSSLGFASSDNSKEEGIRNEAIKILSPELYNRIDEVILFENLSVDELLDITKIKVKLLNKKLKKHKINIELPEEILFFIAKKAYDQQLGARPIDRLLKKEVEDKICEIVLSKNLKTNSKIGFFMDDSEIKFEVS
jgi:ATP-dependent Clp protease ATP-binding subunit ClpC